MHHHQDMLNIVVASIHEARPLIDHYAMAKLQGAHPFIIYTRAQLTLIISGLGKINAAAATGYLQALSLDKGMMAWLNLGIAGHRTLEIGQGFMAHRVRDDATGKSYYSPHIYPFPFPSSDLTTVDQVEHRYENDGGYDMEASAYYKIALRSSTLELIHCYKIISDNRQHPVKKMTKETIIALINNRLNEIANILKILVSEVEEFRKLDRSNQEYHEITQRWHFTETQKRQLNTLLQRGSVIYGKSFSSQIKYSSDQTAKTFLAHLKQTLAASKWIL